MDDGAGAAVDAAAGAVVEQATRGVRTVCSLGSEALEASRYSEQLRQVERIGARQGLYFGLGLGLTMMSTFIAYAVTAMMGSGCRCGGVSPSNTSSAARTPLAPSPTKRLFGALTARKLWPSRT